MGDDDDDARDMSMRGARIAAYTSLSFLFFGRFGPSHAIPEFSLGGALLSPSCPRITYRFVVHATIPSWSGSPV